MTEIYNITNISSASNLVEVTQQVNQMTGELFGLFILISLFIIMVISFRGLLSERIAASAFLTTLIAFLFRVIDMTGDLVVTVFVLITAGSVVIMYYTTK